MTGNAIREALEPIIAVLNSMEESAVEFLRRTQPDDAAGMTDAEIASLVHPDGSRCFTDGSQHKAKYITVGDLRRARTAYDAIGSDPANVDYEWEAKTAWSCQADDANQWDSLGADEKEGLKAVVAFAIGRGRSFARGDAIGSGLKALEWRDSDAGNHSSAHSELGLYVVSQTRSGSFRVFVLWIDPGGNDADREICEAGSLLEAKAAAQADFERRVLSCLSTHTAAGAGPVGESVGMAGARAISNARMTSVSSVRIASDNPARIYARPVEKPAGPVGESVAREEVRQTDGGFLTKGERAAIDKLGEATALRRELAETRSALKAHHDWHLAQEEGRDGVGGAEAYAESPLFSQTVAALRDARAAPAPEKAAPIPAEVLAQAEKASWWMLRNFRLSQPSIRDVIARAIMQDRASQEERIREDERDRLRLLAHQEAFAAKSPACRRLYLVEAWLSQKDGQLPAERSRLRGEVS